LETETILYLLYQENNVEISKEIAGLMMSGIISDTLLLTSPTTTDIDRDVLAKVSKIAGIDYEKYGMEMFKAGSSMEGKSINEIIHIDFKNFDVNNQKIGIGQISTMSTDDIMSQKDEFINELNEIAKNEGYSAVALFVTDILKNGSYILFNQNSKEIFSHSFDIEPLEESHFFEGVVSRKKQIVPKIMNYLDNK
jgi:manganese-dependent inorganic pyrophosphatase